MDTRQRICTGLLLGFLGAALLLPHFDDTTLTFLLPLLLPPLLAVITARLRFSLPPLVVRPLAITLGAASLALCWAHAETQARQAAHRAERDYMLGEGAFLAAVAAATPPELAAPKRVAPASAPEEDPYEAPWEHDIERVEHIGPWPTPGGPPLPLAFRWLATDTAVDNRTCGPGVQRFTHGARTVSALVELPRWPLYLRVPALGTHIWLVALALATALLLTRRTALARMLVGAALLTGLAWARTPVTLDETHERRLTLAARDLLSERRVEFTTLTPCPAPLDVRFVAGPAGIVADVSRHEEHKWMIFLYFLAFSAALGVVLGLLIHGLERPRRV